ncbi:hypothetical protein [Nannocystis pusilla]|uniref:Outer membrane lipoprotein BamD-like domain-containing protein n=1 Tax=Nannocystis pusilla TaxID=889268 RepID=A0ABS7TSY4_9BACT|nr:hypothetical protein [Nannocystis pusilla]MBZ5711295.1 hypothetical protein [Nannocystis pusilla]
MTQEPTRLLDDVTTSAGLRRDLTAAVRHRVPYDAGAGAARFEASLAKGAGAASSGWGAGTLGLGALILGGLIGAGLWLSRGPDPSPPEVALGGAGVTARSVQAAPETVLEDRVQETDRPGAQGPVAVLEDRSGETAGAAPAEAPEEVVEDMSERSAADARGDGKKARARKAARVEAARGSGDGAADYLREARSLQAARGFLGRDPAEALARAEAGAAEFKAGQFAQEWEGVAVLALFELDRQTEAERRAAAFLTRFPNGPYASQVREALDRQ